jgi:hypothetical protein
LPERTYLAKQMICPIGLKVETYPRVFQWLHIVPWRQIQRLGYVPQV